MDALSARHDAASGGGPFDQVTDLLGNRLYRVGDGAAKPLTTAVVVGRFVNVEKGRGFTVQGNDAPSGQLTTFDDADALWRTIHATFEVESVVSGDAEPGPVRVGFALGADTPPDKVFDDLLHLGRAVLFLSQSAVFDYDRSIHATSMDGALVAPVAADGKLSLPVLGPQEGAAMLRDASTLDELRQSASLPERIIDLDPSGTRILSGG